MSVPSFNGTEIPILAIPPDWNQSMPQLTIAEQTTISEALDQSEERWTRRPRPFYGLSFSTTAIGSREQGQLRKLFETIEALPIGVPMWTEEVKLAADQDAGLMSLSIDDSTGTLFGVFDYLILWQDWENWEVLHYDAPNSTFNDSISLLEATTRAWPAGTSVIPVAFGYCARPDFSALDAEDSQIRIDFEERLFFSGRRQPDEPIPPIVPEVTYTACLDEITVAWPAIAGLTNVEILHGASADGPWLWWGETRKAATQIVLSNYFKNRYLLIRGQRTGETIQIAKFHPLPPAVDPPIVTVKERLTSDLKAAAVEAGVMNLPAGYTGTKTASIYGSSWELPYGGGYAARDDGVPVDDTARDRIAAVYSGNKVDPVSGDQQYKLNLFSDAFVELQWRYGPNIYSGVSRRVVDVYAESDQPGVTIKWTLDGTDPSLINGYDSGAVTFPNPDIYLPNEWYPYVIARCFKDGCKSPPIYVPIDVVRPQANRVTVTPYGGTGTERQMCPIYRRDADCVTYPAGDGLTPCPLDPDLANRVLLEAASSTTVTYDTPNQLRSWGGDGEPWFCTLPELGEVYWGIDPGGCPTELYGGGSWRMSTGLNWTKELTFFRSSDDWGNAQDDSTAFFLIHAAMTHNAVAMNVPTLPTTPRQKVTGLGGDGSTNTGAAALNQAFADSASFVFIAPMDFSTDLLTGVWITTTCAGS